MANWVTGSTDTGADLNTRAIMRNSVLLVGEGNESAVKEKLFSITGTADAATYFKTNSLASEIIKMLIQNGANNIKGILVGEYGADKTYISVDDAYEAALNISLADDTIKCVVLDTSSTASLFTTLKEHLDTAEDNDMFRYGVIGLPTGSIDTAYGIQAQALNSKRMFIVGPNVVNADNVERDGAVAAGGLAGLIMSDTSDPALPLNSVPILGCSGTVRVMLRTDRNNLANAGVVALYPEDGQAIVWRLVTTYSNEDKVWSEGSTSFIADDVLDSVMAKLKTNYKRTKNVQRVLDSIRTDVIGVLEDKQGLEIIKNFDSNTVSVVEDPDDKYGALVDYEFQVVTPLYTITIRQHMKV